MQTPRTWLKDLRQISEKVERKRSECGVNTNPIRIAILDMGVNMNFPAFQERSGLHERITMKDFMSSDTEAQAMTDDHGHGTFMVRLILECAPATEIIVARVAQNTNALAQSQKNIQEAILWAGMTAEANIISMSFGLPRDDSGIREAIEDVQRHRKDRIIFFASAGNSPTDDESFPARHHAVISVYATDRHEKFLSTNPVPTGSSAYVIGTYGDLGDSLREEFCDLYPKVFRPGTSIATAIMAGISATMLAYVSALPYLLKLQGNMESITRRLSEHMWTSKGVEKLLNMMVPENSNQLRQRAVSPIWFWKNRPDDFSRYFAIYDALAIVDKRLTE